VEIESVVVPTVVVVAV
jgi:hypothetical protein